MRLFIAEKPSVGRVIADCLGIKSKQSGYIECKDDSIVTWCFGHILKNAPPEQYTGSKIWKREDLPIIPNPWVLVPDPEAKTQLNLIKNLLKKAAIIIHAGDPDREGQLLVEEVLEYFKVTKPVKRYWASAQDVVSVKKALNNLEDNAAYHSWGKAALARSRADWLLGMNLTQANTLAAREMGVDKLLSVGRVQTPTLALVVRRDLQIENFKPKPFFRLSANLVQNGNPFSASFKPDNSQEGLDEENRLVDKNIVAKIADTITNQNGRVSEFKEDLKKKSPPLCFSGSSLAIMASRLYGYTAKEVLDITQSLYEKKITTYPRTDSEYLPIAQFSESQLVLKAIGKIADYAEMVNHTDLTIQSRVWNDQKVTAHHAIIPTLSVHKPDELTKAEKNILDLIIRYYVAQFYPDYEYHQRQALITIKEYDFVCSSHTPFIAGWKSALKDTEADPPEAEKTSHIPIPPMRPGDMVFCNGTKLTEEKTRAPSQFTEGTLINAMMNIHKFTSKEYSKFLKESDGIGTTATRAIIVEELVKKGFLERKKKYLVSTVLGRELIESLPGKITEPGITAYFEKNLQAIQNGEADLKPFYEKQIEFVNKEIERAFSKERKINFEVQRCPQCNKPLCRRKNGKVYWWGCTGYPDCKATFSDNQEKPVFQKKQTTKLSEMMSKMKTMKSAFSEKSNRNSN